MLIPDGIGIQPSRSFFHLIGRASQCNCSVQARFLILVTGPRSVIIEDRLVQLENRGDACIVVEIIVLLVSTLPSMELTARRNLAAVRSRANIHIRVDRSTCPVSRRRKRKTRLQRFLARQFQIKSSRIRIRLCPILSVSKGDDIDENDKSSLESMAKKIYLRAEGGRTKDADSMSNLSRRNKPIRRGRKKKRKRQT